LPTANNSKAWVIVTHSAFRSPFGFCHGGYKRALQNQALPYLQHVVPHKSDDERVENDFF
jgi:hypothetical protein